MTENHNSPYFARAYGFQRRAVTKLLDLIQEHGHYASGDNPLHILLSAPTGSGKTFMMAMFADALSRHSQSPPLFVWVTIGRGGLASQSLVSFSNTSAFSGRLHTLSEIGHTLCGGDLVFTNWEDLRATKKSDPTMKVERDTERGMSLANQARLLSAAGTPVYLVVDESHATADSDLSNAIVEKIGPSVVVHVSATPKPVAGAYPVPVLPHQPRDEGLIKRGIVVNRGISSALGLTPETSANAYLEAAIACHAYLKGAALEKGFLPLLLVQIEDGISADKEVRILNALSNAGFSESNGKLAVWLSEKKVNVEGINAIGSSVEALVFKQAIATGWDCPRAYTLCQIRNVVSNTLQLQTLGRVMRLPQGLGLKDHKSLSYGYLFAPLTNPHVQTHEEGMFFVDATFRDDHLYGPGLCLVSEHAGGVRRELAVAADVAVIAERLAEEWLPLVAANDLSTLATWETIQDYTSEVATLYAGSTAKRMELPEANLLKMPLGPDDLEDAFLRLLISSTRGVRADWVANHLAEATFAALTLLGYCSDDEERQKHAIVANYRRFSSGIVKVVCELGRKSEVQSAPKVNFGWEVPHQLSVSAGASKRMMSNDGKIPSLHSAFINEGRPKGSYRCGLSSNPEARFIEWIFENKTIYRGDTHFDAVWWWKNGDNGEDHLGINYLGEDALWHTFYPDFLIFYRTPLMGEMHDVLLVAEVKDANESSSTTALKRDALSKWLSNKPSHRDGLRVVGDVFRVQEDGTPVGWSGDFLPDIL